MFPGLKAIEKKVIVRSSGFVVILFAAGVSLGYFVTLPIALKMLMWWNDYMEATPLWTLPKYITFCTQIIMAFGLVFQMPVIILILGKMGLVTAQQLREKRRHVIVLLLVLAMLLTPPDVFTQLIMAGPLVILYELCIWMLRALERKKAKLEGGETVSSDVEEE